VSKHQRKGETLKSARLCLLLFYIALLSPGVLAQSDDCKKCNENIGPNTALDCDRYCRNQPAPASKPTPASTAAGATETTRPSSRPIEIRVQLVHAPASRTTPGPTVAEKSSALDYRSAEGRFSALFPKPPNVRKGEVTAKTGETLQQTTEYVSDGEHSFAVSYFDYGVDMKFSIEGALVGGRNGILQSVNGTLLTEEPIGLDGAQGQGVKIHAKTSAGTKFFARVQVYDINRRVYFVQCMSTDNGAMSKCNKFADSFKVTGR
jgi:hypothetical protein